MNNKSLSEMTFDELVTYCAWTTAESLLKGTPLRSTICQICDIAIRWHKDTKKR